MEMDVRGIHVKLKIKGYESSENGSWDARWCKCDHAFCSGDWLNYHKEDDEILLSCEVEELEVSLTKLLNDELSEIKEICCMEPDYIFTLYPKKDLRKDPNYTYLQPGYEIKDICVEWKVYFWYEGLTDNFLTVTLKREEIIRFRDYLSSVMKGL